MSQKSIKGRKRYYPLAGHNRRVTNIRPTRGTSATLSQCNDQVLKRTTMYSIFSNVSPDEASMGVFTWPVLSQVLAYNLSRTVPPGAHALINECAMLSHMLSHGNIAS
jgi:hypothetical protein